MSSGGAPAEEHRPSPLESAMATERGLREQVNDLVNARHRAQAEARRLGERAGVPGTDPSLAGVGERYRTQAERLGEEIESLRRSLREQEATTEALRADEAGV